MKVTKKNVASKFWQNGQYIVSYYSPEYRAYTHSRPMDFFAANRMLQELRKTWNTKKQDYDCLYTIVVKKHHGKIVSEQKQIMY